MSNIEERVKKIIIEQLGVKEEDVKNTLPPSSTTWALTLWIPLNW